MNTKIKYPLADGLEKAQNSFKDLLNQEPSEELIRIINENNKLIDEEDGVGDKQDRAARSPEAQP
jgi:hypothetical protein